MTKNNTDKKQLEDLYIEDLGQVTGGKKPAHTPTSKALGEEDCCDVTTLAIGEEDVYTTLAIGEEDDGVTM